MHAIKRASLKLRETHPSNCGGKTCIEKVVEYLENYLFTG